MMACVGILTLEACTEDFKELNTNPHEVTDEMLSYDNLRIGGFIPQMQADIVPTSDKDANEYQRAQNLAGDVYSGYMGAIHNWNNNRNNTTYDFSQKWHDVAFEVAFTKVMPAWKSIAQNSKDENPTTYALAQVLKVACMSRITDMYGPLPYSQFGKTGMHTPYDTQESIYESFFVDLDEAIDILEDFVQKTPNAKPLKRFDLVYGGDFKMWIRFANSLKLRLAMRTAYVTPAKAQTRAEEAVQHLLIEENTQNALLQSANGVSIFNPLKICWDNYNDIRMGANMESFLTGYSDPRISRYFQGATYDEDQEYRGVRNGIRVNNRDAYIKYSSPNIFSNTPVVWMTAAETNFLRAEGAIRGWNMNGEAQAFYEKGVTLSFNQWGAAIGDYLNNETSVAAPYTDPAGYGNDIPEGNSLLSTITIKWADGDSFERKLERIITQKWIAIYPDGQEAWTEFRRTGYPKVFPVVSNNSNGTVDTDTQIRRLPFPTTEYDNNNDEVNAAIGLLGGSDNGGTKLWWDKK